VKMGRREDWVPRKGDGVCDQGDQFFIRRSLPRRSTGGGRGSMMRWKRGKKLTSFSEEEDQLNTVVLQKGDMTASEDSGGEIWRLLYPTN